MSRPNAGMAFLLGAAAGGIAAVLMAPDRGSRTRRRLKEGAEHVVSRGEDLLADAKDTVQTTVEDVTGTAQQHIEAGRTAVAEGKDAFLRELEAEGSSS
ncbi:MAG: YtxH domain-containing protein [Gemmatimonadetes bacterium]|nr:YtxH domain-containing protein [Gemmatimonadota bacterium]